MITRRSLAIAGISAAAVYPIVARAGHLVTVLEPNTPSEGPVLFDNGIATGQPPSAISSNVGRLKEVKYTTLANLGGASPYAFLSFMLNALAVPIATMPIFVVKSDGNDIFRVEIHPQTEGFQVWDPGLQRMVSGGAGVPTLRTLVAGFAGGVWRYSNYITLLPKFALEAWQLYRIFVNGTQGDSGVGTVQVMHNVTGENPNTPTVQFTQYGPFYPGNNGRPNSPIYVDWGYTGGPQPDYHVAADPSYGPDPSNAVHGGLDNMLFTPNFPADPLSTQQAMVNAVGGFTRPPFGGAGLIFPGSPIMPIHLTGGPALWGGFGDNSAAPLGDSLTIDTSFNAPEGFKPYSLLPDELGSPYD